jgi:general secretion pathway protein K
MLMVRYIRQVRYTLSLKRRANYHRHATFERGMALIAVLWIVAALSIMVMGMTQTVRQSIRSATMERDLVQGQAMGQAAIALALQEIWALPDRIVATDSAQISYANTNILVTAAPLNGWVALNGAPAPMLAAILQSAGGLDSARAQQMAATIVDWRDGTPQLPADALVASGSSKRRFEAVEDLMLVPGMNYDLYKRIEHLFTVHLSSSAPVNSAAAPPEVAQALGGNTAFIVASRPESGNLLRLQATVPLSAGKILVLTQDAALQRQGSNAPAPWRILRESVQIQTPNALHLS